MPPATTAADLATQWDYNVAYGAELMRQSLPMRNTLPALGHMLSQLQSIATLMQSPPHDQELAVKSWIVGRFTEKLALPSTSDDALAPLITLWTTEPYLD